MALITAETTDYRSDYTLKLLFAGDLKEEITRADDPSKRDVITVDGQTTTVEGVVFDIGKDAYKYSGLAIPYSVETGGAKVLWNGIPARYVAPLGIALVTLLSFALYLYNE